MPEKDPLEIGTMKELCQQCKEGYRFRDDFNHLTACTNQKCKAKFKGIWKTTEDMQ